MRTGLFIIFGLIYKIEKETLLAVMLILQVGSTERSNLLEKKKKKGKC